MRDYGKVFSRIWESADFRSLTEDGRSLVMYLLTCQHGTIAGVFRVPDGYACEDLQWTAERVAKGFANLAEKGFATRCEASKWVWVAKFLEWNPPENPNQRLACAKIARQVPDSCGWKQAFMRVCWRLLAAELEKAGEPLPNPSTTVPQPVSVAVAVAEEVSEAKASSSAGPTSKPTIPCPYEAIVGLYHEVLPSLPQCRLMPTARQKAMRKLWGWVLSSTKAGGQRRATNSDEALQWLRDYFGRAADNDFLMGRTARSAEHSGWQCDIDFLLSEKGMKQVIEKTQVAA